jgi:hypothetical protein
LIQRRQNSTDSKEQEAKIEIADGSTRRAPEIGDEEEAKTPLESVVSYNKIKHTGRIGSKRGFASHIFKKYLHERTISLDKICRAFKMWRKVVWSGI